MVDFEVDTNINPLPLSLVAPVSLLSCQTYVEADLELDDGLFSPRALLTPF